MMLKREYLARFSNCKLRNKEIIILALQTSELSYLCIPEVKKEPPEVFYKKAVLTNFAIFTGKHLCWNLF